MVLFSLIQEANGALDLDGAARGDADCAPPEVARRLGLGGGICLWLSSATLEAAPSEEQQALLKSTNCTIGPFELTQADAAREWLNDGAIRCIFSVKGEASAAAAIKRDTAGLPAERLMAALQVGPLDNAATLPALLSTLEELGAGKGTGCLECCAPETVGVVGGVLLQLPPAPAASAKKQLDARLAQEDALIEAIAPFAKKDRLRVLIDGLAGDARLATGDICAGAAKVGKLHFSSIDVVARATLGGGATNDGRLVVGECVACCARSDRPDGLYTTVVCDEGGVALGLVYSNTASLKAAVNAGRGVYWSRSRGGLWRKGDTSGAWQALHSIGLDCDNDAIAFRVTQHGAPPAFCHKGCLTCWGVSAGLRALELTLRQRRASAPAGSYTKRLFDDSELLRNKLLEEAQELAEAEEVRARHHPKDGAPDPTDSLRLPLRLAPPAQLPTPRVLLPLALTRCAPDLCWTGRPRRRRGGRPAVLCTRALRGGGREPRADRGTPRRALAQGEAPAGQRQAVPHRRRRRSPQEARQEQGQGEWRTGAGCGAAPRDRVRGARFRARHARRTRASRLNSWRPHISHNHKPASVLRWGAGGLRSPIQSRGRHVGAVL